MRLSIIFVIPVVFVFVTGACNFSTERSSVTDTTYTLSVSVKGLDSGLFILYYKYEGVRKADSLWIRNGSGTIKGRMPNPVRAYLQRIEPQGYDMLPLYLENGTIQVAGVLDSMSAAKVGGTASNELNQQLQKILEPVRKAELELNNAFQSAGPDRPINQDSIFARYNEIDGLRKKLTISFVAAYPNTMVSLNEVLEMFLYNPDAKQFDSAVQLLDTALLNSESGRELVKRLDIAKRTDIGMPAPEFSMKDVSGKEIELRSRYGKYLLLDFWASWCGPCRQDNPNLVRTYSDFSKKGFDIISVSLDEQRDRDKWLDAIRKDGLTWLQLSDLKGWDNIAARLYGINGIPMNFLLDPQGRIIAKGLRGNDLRKKVESLLLSSK